MGWSIGLVVMRGNSCPRGHEFESQHQIQHECFFTLFAVKLKVLMSEKTKNKRNYEKKVTCNDLFLIFDFIIFVSTRSF